MPSRPAIRASSDGAATPVTVVETTRSTSSGRRPASSSAPATAAEPELDSVLDEQVVGFAEVLQRGVLIQRQDEVTIVDLGTAMQAAKDLFVLAVSADRQEGFGDLGLTEPVRW